ncbi:MAG: Na+/H+ antiporter NhaA [bacterium]
MRFLLENSLFLVLGATAALIWANVDFESYHRLVHLELFHTDFVGHPHGAHRVVTLGFVINELLMALFFAIAGKEVWEATLPGGPLNNPRKAAAPLIATLGGMTGPAVIFLAGAALMGRFDELHNGWAIPTATDIAFSYLVARLVFGGGHPAIPFLLLLAIADDALGLIIIAVFYPQGPVELLWMLLPVAAVIIGLALRRNRVVSFWPYLLVCGLMSWYGFHRANLHPALGLLPIIPVMPHAHMDKGLFHWAEMQRDDTLNAFEHWWKNPVEVVLGLFGLLNAGVAINAIGDTTWLVLAGLIVGKPVGVWVFGMLGTTVGFSLPEGMRRRELFAVGCAAGIGFTVAIFVSGVAFPAGPTQDAAKIGALGSFGAAIVTFIVARALGVKRIDTPDHDLPPEERHA